MLRFTHRSALTLLVAGAAVLPACSDDADAPLAPTSRSASVSAGSGAHMVVFRNEQGIPADFAQKVAELGGTVDATYAQIGMATVSGLSDEGAAALRGHSGVGSVDLDPQIALNVGPHAIGDSEVSEAEIASPTAPQTAILFARQWNMKTIGADKAWQAGFRGSSSVTVAILDTGIDYTLLDTNGRVDLARSKSFLPQDDSVVAALFPGRHPISDLNGHGTNVASQVSSNAIAFAGVTSQVRLMGVKVCSVYGSCPFSATFAGIAYAVDAGADVINMSLGGGFFKNSCNGCTSVIERALRYAEKAGVTVVVSAGNEAADLDHDGSYYNTYCNASHVICVAATGPTHVGPTGTGPFQNIDAPAVYTNYGRSAITVAAPGGNYSLKPDGTLLSVGWVYSLCTKTGLNYNPATGVLSKTVCSLNPGSTFTSGYLGTSQASPHVAGLAALMVEKYGRSPAQIRQAIRGSADQIGVSGNDPFYGKGRINVARAVGAIN